MSDLQGLRVAIIVAQGCHDHEFWYPYYRFREAGAEVVVAAPTAGEIAGEGRHGCDGLPIRVPNAVEQIADQDFGCIYLPGGIMGPLALRAHRPTLEMLRRANDQGKIIAAICHGPWILVSAGLVAGKRITCPEDMADDVTNAGGMVVSDRAVRDGNLITAYSFRFLPDHFRLLMPVLEGLVS